MHARDLRFLRCLRFPLLLADPARYQRPETPARSLLWFGCGRSAALGSSALIRGSKTFSGHGLRVERAQAWTVAGDDGPQQLLRRRAEIERLRQAAQGTDAHGTPRIHDRIQIGL